MARRVQLNRGRIERPNVEQTPYLLHVFPKQEGIGYELLLSCAREITSRAFQTHPPNWLRVHIHNLVLSIGVLASSIRRLLNLLFSGSSFILIFPSHFSVTYSISLASFLFSFGSTNEKIAPRKWNEIGWN